MKRMMLMTAVLGTFALGSGGWVAAETPSKTAPPPAAPHQHAAPPPAAKDAPAAKGGMGMGMMGGGGVGMGMMGGGGMCPMMSATDTLVAVKNTDKGVTITYTSSDPAKVARLQKMAEAMRLMHEANTP